MSDDTADGWFWWASGDGENYTVGPCATRDEVLQKAASAGIATETPEGLLQLHIVQAQNPPERKHEIIVANPAALADLAAGVTVGEETAE